MKNALMAPYTFVLMNWAAVLGLFYFLRNDNNVPGDIWTSRLHSHDHSASGDVGRVRPERFRPAA